VTACPKQEIALAPDASPRRGYYASGEGERQRRLPPLRPPSLSLPWLHRWSDRWPADFRWRRSSHVRVTRIRTPSPPAPRQPPPPACRTSAPRRGLRIATAMVRQTTTRAAGG